MKTQSSFSSIAQAIKFALVSIGALLSDDIHQKQLNKPVEYSVSIQKAALESLSDEKIFISSFTKAMIQTIPSFTSLVQDLQKQGFSYLFAQTVPISEIEALHVDLRELETQLNVIEKKFGSETREIVKKLKKFHRALQDLYQDIAMYAYKKEADEVVLSRINSEISDSFDETYSREAIRRTLLG